MVYDYGYEHGYEKRKDQRTESQTEGKIQYFTLASISSLEHPTLEAVLLPIVTLKY